MVDSLLTEDEIRCYSNRGDTCEQSAMVQTHEVVFLFDVDNTLLDNDHVQADLSEPWPELSIAARDLIGKSSEHWSTNPDASTIGRAGDTDQAMHRPELLRMSRLAGRLSVRRALVCGGSGRDRPRAAMGTRGDSF